MKFERYDSGNTTLFGDNDSFVVFGGTSDTLMFIGSARDTVVATGHTQQISLMNTQDMRIADEGQGLCLWLGRINQNVTLRDFQNDPTGHVMLYNQGVISMAPDGHGGTLLTTSYGTLDFVGDAHVRADQVLTIGT